MPLTPGSRIGPYEVKSVLGAGGMGEVYRARDAKIGRDVALKILPDLVASDPDRRARFEREAKTLGALNHPHIAQIYGFEQSAGSSALVMELVEGEDLAQRIARGAIPPDEALPIARQIAQALEAAHEQGIIHRDLKPANIKVRSDGTVKVLDFGLAKVFAAAEGQPSDSDAGRLNPTNSPTITTPAAVTVGGMILGTAAYMAPEQAKGRAVDRRADIWAFGCVLYEMLTGRRAFLGDDVSETIASVLKTDVEWTALPVDTPPHVRRLLRRCLAKDVRRRLRDIGDAGLDLEETHASDDAIASGPARRPSVATRLGWFAAGMLVVAGAVFLLRQWTPAESQLSNEGVQLLRLTDAIGNEASPALSPDGKTVAFVAAANGRRQIWIRLLTSGSPLQLTRADADHEQPRWAPDSAAIVYFTAGRSAGDPGTLWEIPALGGPPRRLIAAASGGDVSRDGKRIAVFQIRGGQTVLATAARDGSGLEIVSALPPGWVFASPRWSPDGRWIAYQRASSAEFDKRVTIIDSSGGEARDIAKVEDVKGLAWLPDGSGIVYSSSRGSTVLYPPTLNLRAVGVDGTNDRQVTFGDISYVDPDVHPTAGITAARITSQSDLWKLPIDGSPVENVQRAMRVTHQTAVAQVPSVSPDERELVYLSDSGGHGNLWIAATDGSGARQITFEHDPSVAVGVPVWSPTSNAIAFLLTRAGVARQWIINSDGSGLRELGGGFWGCWSSDGKWLYTVFITDSGFHLAKTPVDGGPSVQVRSDDVTSPALASDGTLYFASPIRGTSGVWEWEIRKARPEGAPASTLARVNGARIPVEDVNIHPILSPDGKWLVQPLIDGATSNLWLIDTANGEMRRATDFGGRPTVIGRRVAWSRDSRSIYAAIAHTDSDVVLLRNVRP